MARDFGVKVGTILEEFDTHLQTLESQLSTQLSEAEATSLQKAYDDLRELKDFVSDKLKDRFPLKCAPGEYQPPPPTVIKP